MVPILIQENTDCDPITDLIKYSEVRLSEETSQEILPLSNLSQQNPTVTDTAKPMSKYIDACFDALGDPPEYSRIGHSGEHVEKLQRALQLKKLYKGKVNGVFDTRTEDAFKIFEKKESLEINGECDYNTSMKLFGRTIEAPPANNTPVANQNKGSEISDWFKSDQSAISSPEPEDSSDSRVAEEAIGSEKKYSPNMKGERTPIINTDLFGNSTQIPAPIVPITNPAPDTNSPKTSVPIAPIIKNQTPETKKLDWFLNGVNAIPKRATFSVKDVATGRIFSAVRWSGGNHLDAEPASAADTKVIKEVFGGDWSWARRSILVKYKDHIYAGSMNGMPHGTTVVDSNNFSGHFCIHFYNSRTHETNRVDEDHQNAVNAAMRSSW